MSTDSRRRLGAITALVLGLFVGLTLLPLPITGPVGRTVGHGLWQILGAGALGIPLLGIGLALAGFDRLGGLDMKRSAILIVGLSVLIPYVVGVLSDVSPADLDADVGQRGFAARMVGLVPGFLAESIAGKIGVAGAVLLGFLALSALTLATFAWHPLQRFEAGQAGSAGGVQKAQSPTSSDGSAEQGERRRKRKEPEEPEPVAEEGSGILAALIPRRPAPPGEGAVAKPKKKEP